MRRRRRPGGETTIYIYIYIYINISLSLPLYKQYLYLSLSIYIYIYIPTREEIENLVDCAIITVDGCMLGQQQVEIEHVEKSGYAGLPCVYIYIYIYGERERERERYTYQPRRSD